MRWVGTRLLVGVVSEETHARPHLGIYHDIIPLWSESVSKRGLAVGSTGLSHTNPARVSTGVRTGYHNPTLTRH